MLASAIFFNDLIVVLQSVVAASNYLFSIFVVVDDVMMKNEERRPRRRRNKLKYRRHRLATACALRRAWEQLTPRFLALPKTKPTIPARRCRMLQVWISV